MVVMEEEWVFGIEDFLRSVRDNHAWLNGHLVWGFGGLLFCAHLRWARENEEPFRSVPEGFLFVRCRGLRELWLACWLMVDPGWSCWLIGTWVR